MSREITINIVHTDGTTEILTAMADAITEVRRDLNNDPTVAKWEVEC